MKRAHKQIAIWDIYGPCLIGSRAPQINSPNYQTTGPHSQTCNNGMHIPRFKVIEFLYEQEILRSFRLVTVPVVPLHY